MSGVSASAFSDTKPHYLILDGLRGVAALMVVFFHVFEAFATSHLDQRVNHGYLGVDFFFILSGFVVAYAYDDRQLRPLEFLKRRLIRLQPMVVFGAVLGAGLFYFQKSSVWDVSTVTVSALLLATVMNALMVPAPQGIEVRGLGEMFPLNGPTWTLFFEYIGNLLYIVFLRRLSTPVLGGLVFLAGCGLATFAMAGPLGDVCAGWALTGTEVTGGMLRLLFSFSAGLLLSRLFKPVNVKGAFWICTLALVVLLGWPRIGGAEKLWLNGLYETVCILVVFPLLVVAGASGKVTHAFTGRICKFLGDISYPLYLVHYPFIYMYYAWVKNKGLTFEASFPGAAALVIGSVVLAWLALKFYDIPVRRYLSRRFFGR